MLMFTVVFAAWLAVSTLIAIWLGGKLSDAADRQFRPEAGDE